MTCYLSITAPLPSLLHGDLWHGNAARSVSGEVIAFDPASYYGDRETDLAMTSLFGGFPHAFMKAYNAEWPLDEGYRMRRDFYNVYHLLNHLNLFGRGYLSQVEAIMARVLATFDAI
ncbi:MAG: fructosamine kinase family protein [Pseudomonadota bacterium]